MSLKSMLERIEYEENVKEHSIPTPKKKRLSLTTYFFEKEYIELFDDVVSANGYSESISEMVGNACEHGNKFDSSKHVRIKYFVGGKGMLTEVTDEGEGIPEEKIQMLQKRDRNEQFHYGDRGRGYYSLNRRLCERVIDDVEIEGTSVRLLKMYSSRV